MDVQFSKTARSERYFTALLLPHLLMTHNFAGACALFNELGLDVSFESDFSSVEIVAELNPLRDVKHYKHDSSNDCQLQKYSVPDLFVRIGKIALVIEAKFFTYPSSSSVLDQLESQKKAIEMVIPFTKYSDCKFYFMALTVLPFDDITNLGTNTFHRTWHHVISILKSVAWDMYTKDIKYALWALEDAAERSKKEAVPYNKIQRVKSIMELLENSTKIIEAGNFYVGFTGGINALKKSSIEDMEKRGHYKCSDCSPNNNWLPIHEVISYYLELKADAKRKVVE